MPDWPRTIKPARQTIPRFPGAASSWGGSGKGQTRDLIAAGRIWEEWYPILEYDDEDARALITTINDYWRNGTSFDIENYLLNTQNGVGGGTPLVDGAAQTGSTLHTDGWPVSTNGVLKKGDIYKVAGVPYVIDVTADVDSDGTGDADIPGNPPIWESPADGAALTITGVKFTAVIYAPPDLPAGGPGHFIGGAHLVFRELL